MQSKACDQKVSPLTWCIRLSISHSDVLWLTALHVPREQLPTAVMLTAKDLLFTVCVCV